jgi:hypothetical protein
VTGNPQVHGLPDAGIAIGDKGIAVRWALAGPLVAELIPVDPVVPAVGELDAVDVLQCAFRSDFDSQGVGPTGVDPRRHIEFVGVVHADDPVAAGDEVAVQPDLGTIADTGKLQHVAGVTCWGAECGAVPPILLPQIWWHAVAKVGTDVQVGKGAVALQGLQDGRRHPADRMPTRVLIVGPRQRCAVGSG